MHVDDFCDYDNSFPDEFYACLPRECPDCGAPMEMSEALTQLHCSNPKCPSKVVQRMVAMAADLGVKDLGEARATKLVSEFGLDNPLLLFSYEPDKDGVPEGMSFDVANGIVSQLNAKRRMTLAEYVKLAHLPFIQTSSQALFGGYDTLDEAYAALEEGGLGYVCRKLDISADSDVSVRAARVYETLKMFKSDLYQCIDFVEIIKMHSADMVHLTAVCSDEVGFPFKTKADFYATVNNLYQNLHVEFLGALTRNCDYLVWAGADGSPARLTNKVKKARAYNEKYEEHKASGTLKEGEHEIKIVSAKQFLYILEQLVK